MRDLDFKEVEQAILVKSAGVFLIDGLQVYMLD